MTQAELFSLVGFIILIVGAIAAAWWRIEGKVKEVKQETDIKVSANVAKADLAREELATYKLHVAETYVTKSGMTEQTAALTRAITDIGDRLDKRLDGVTERLDRVIEHNHKPIRRSPN